MLWERDTVLNEYWHFFAHDWPIERDSVNIHGRAQPKSVFSFTLTLIDKVLACTRSFKFVPRGQWDT